MQKNDTENTTVEVKRGKRAYQRPFVERFELTDVVRAGGSGALDSPFSGQRG
jgi:hypothetical protein